ncbi:hypothetical protein AB0E52_09305 [Micrococcus luteus]|uniref:hypothetical protein n=1 Tax=Micrococcaceae TaxID=1268 RepID=UPI003325A9C1
MTTLYYSANEMGREAGFTSPGTWTRMKNAMGAPECVMVSKAPGFGWSLNTWEITLDRHSARLQEALRPAIERLRAREVELLREFSAGSSKPAPAETAPEA